MSTKTSKKETKVNPIKDVTIELEKPYVDKLQDAITNRTLAHQNYQQAMVFEQQITDLLLQFKGIDPKKTLEVKLDNNVLHVKHRVDESSEHSANGGENGQEQTE